MPLLMLGLALFILAIVVMASLFGNRIEEAIEREFDQRRIPPTGW